MRRLGRGVGREQDGAVAVMVAVSLVVLIGMLVLVVDLGRLWTVRRKLSTGADAAALAVAQQCALGNGSAAAQSAGVATGVSNETGGYTFEITPQCDIPTITEPQLVTASAERDLDMIFAPIFGIDSLPVSAEAVAQWGAVGQSNPIPITVDSAQLLGCGIPGTIPPPGQTIVCELEYPKETLEQPRWGILDLSRWGDPDAAPCRVDANTLREIIENGGWPELLELNYPAPTYDCIDNGLSFSVWKEMEGRILTFPVIDILTSTGTIKPGKGGDCTGADIPGLQAQGKDCQIDTANVIGFVSLLVAEVGKKGSTVVVRSEWLGPTTGGGIPGSGADFGLRAVRLVS